jgi:hypothetical protein
VTTLAGTMSLGRRLHLDRALAVEVSCIVGVAAGVGLLFWWLGVAAVGIPSMLDPWIYTSLFQDFPYLYHAFYGAYYSSRLPWIIPGRIADSIFGPVGGYFALHIVFILAAGTALYGMLRRFFGPRPALVGFALLLTNAIYYISNSDNYPDGAQIAFLLITLSFAVVATTSKWSWAYMVGSGAFALAAFGTNLWTVFFTAGILLVYVIVRLDGGPFFAHVLLDVCGFVAGVLIALTIFGRYAKAYGGEFLFFMPSVREARSLPTGEWRQPGYRWMLLEPRLLSMIIVVLVGTLIVLPRRRRWRDDRAVRLTGGLVVGLAVLTIGLALYEYVGHGIALFDVSYYASVFDSFIIPTAAAVVGLTFREITGRARKLAVALALVACALPDVAIFGGYGHPQWVGRPGFWITLALAGVAVATAFFSRARFARTAVLVALAGIFLFTVNFAAAASEDSGRFVTGVQPISLRIATSHLLTQLIDFMRRSGLQNTSVPPAGFWENSTDYNLVINSVQSAYYYGWTADGLDLPRIDASMRQLITARQTHTLVLLCTSSTECNRGEVALQKAGYKPRLRSAHWLRHAPLQILARAYDLRGTG